MSQRLQFPLTMTFKLLAFAPQFQVDDASGKTVAYVKQKLFKLKEAVTVFTDSSQTQPLYRIAADRVIDFSALYNFTDAQDTVLGSVKRRGMRSLWRAGFDVIDNGATVFSINEKSVFTRFMDKLFSELPIIGMFSGYLFHPTYCVTRPDGTLVMELVKQPAMWEGRYTVEKHAVLNSREEEQLLLSLMMTVLLERTRG